MRHRITYLLFIMSIACASAVPIYAYDAPAPQAFRSHQVIVGGTMYQGTTYAPFDDTAPSEANNSSAKKAPNGPRKAFDTGAEYGRPDEYPVGEPWILAIFAVSFAAIIAIKRKRKGHVREE